MKKSRPQRPDDTIEAVKTHTIDGRTRQAKHMKETIDGLTTSLVSTGKAILKRMVAQNTVIADEIYNHALNSGDLLDERGELNPLVRKHLLRFQGLAKTALLELMRLEGQAIQDGEPEDAFEGVFDE